METLEQLISKAEAGDVQSCFELGQRYALGEGTDADEKAAFDWYLRAARGGNVMAQKAVGICYANGIATDANWDEAAMWYLRALMKGDPEAFRTLSDYYETHETPADGAILEYYRSASEKDDADANYMLGRLYELGVGTAFDPENAFESYKKAC